MELQKLHIDCACGSIDHIMRVIYDVEDQQYYIEFKIGRFPGTWEYPHSLVIDVNMTTLKKIKAYIKWYKDRFVYYINNIIWSIKGRPNWYIAYVSLTKESAEELKTFLQKTISLQ